MESASDGGMAVGIKSSLSARVPLIRQLASAMQWARRKVFDIGRIAIVVISFVELKNSQYDKRLFLTASLTELDCW